VPRGLADIGTTLAARNGGAGRTDTGTDTGVALQLAQLGRVDRFDVYLVRGELLRNHYEIEFTMGGNDEAYPGLVPSGEIWIDDVLGPLDQMATTLHELIEWWLMKHRRMSYEAAHTVASRDERAFRHELEAGRPRRFDAARVEAAYRAFVAEQKRR
jgi:hypothetical protein